MKIGVFIEYDSFTTAKRYQLPFRRHYDDDEQRTSQTSSVGTMSRTPSLPELRRLELVLDTLPDEELVAALGPCGGRARPGPRNDYPVRAMWRALVAGVVFGHRSIASLLRELRRFPLRGFARPCWARAGLTRPGRNDYPVRAMWRALVAGVVFGHRSIASLLRELRRFRFAASPGPAGRVRV